MFNPFAILSSATGGGGGMPGLPGIGASGDAIGGTDVKTDIKFGDFQPTPNASLAWVGVIVAVAFLAVIVRRK